MRELMSRHLGKMLVGAAVAVTVMALAAGVMLSGSVSAAPLSGGIGSSSTAPTRATKEAETVVEQPGVLESRSPDAAKGTGRDPLTAEERKRAEELALHQGGLGGGGRDVRGRAGLELISADLGELLPGEGQVPSPPRRVDLQFYNYQDDTLVTGTVDLGRGEVEAAAVQHGVQPPPTGDEAQEAARVLFTDPLGDALKKDYQLAVGRPLRDVGQLLVTAGVYRVGKENQGPPGAAACQEHRCVRLFTRISNGPWIDTRHLVIDLSARKVVRIR